MDLRDGLELDEPPVRVPWRVSEIEVQRLLGPAVRRVADRYWTADVRVLGGLSCKLAFRFDDGRGGLSTIEFSRGSKMDVADSFDEFQRHLEAAFGPPTSVEAGSQGFPSYRWLLRGVDITHSVFSRFGLTESLSIRRFGAA